MVNIANNMPLPKLSKGVSYDNWNLQMNALLGSLEVWEVVKNGHQYTLKVFRMPNSLR